MRTLDALLRPYPPEVQALARAARQFIRTLLSGVSESVDASAPVVSYGRAPGFRGMVCTLILSKTGVKLGIVGGASFDDCWDLLEGTGKVHRYVQLCTPADLRRPGVRPLLRAADAACRKRLESSDS